MFFYCCSSSIKSVCEPTTIDLSNANLLDRLTDNALATSDISNNTILLESSPVSEKDVEPLLPEEHVEKDTVNTVVDAVVEPSVPCEQGEERRE